MSKQVKRTILDYIKIVLGAFSLAAALSIFLDPHGFVTGGVNGIGIVIKALLSKKNIEIPLAVFNLVLNVPLLVWGVFVKGKRFMFRTIVSTLLLSLFLYLTSLVKFRVEDNFLATVLGGFLSGVGTGLTVDASATTGGTDLLAAILQKSRFKHLSILNILFFIDSAVILSGLVVFGINNSLYALVAVYITSKVGDAITAGLHVSKAVYIISEQWEEISQDVMERMDRGVTGLESVGMFTGTERKMLFCIVSSKEVSQLKHFVYKKDPKAFVIVSDVREAWGEGFDRYE